MTRQDLAPKRAPSYRQRPGYDQAIVTLTDSASGKRRDYWLGVYGSTESREAYHRLLAAWEANGRRWPDAHEPATFRRDNARSNDALTVVEMVAQYKRFAQGYYRPTEYGTLLIALRLLAQMYGRTPAAEFGPTALRLVREAMIRGEAGARRRPWTRSYINNQTRRIRQVFRWAASRELVPATVYTALGTLEPLKRGRCAAREGKVVTPVPKEMVDAVRPFLNRQVAALVDLQLLTGARSGELVVLRPRDIDRTDPSGVWVCRPREHKTASKGKTRAIYFGPAAQRVLAPFLEGRSPDAFLFSPREAEEERRATLTAKRVTPACCGNVVGSNRVEKPERCPRERYHPNAYGRAIARACEKAFPPPKHLWPADSYDVRPETEKRILTGMTAAQREELAAWRKAHHWHPHQLRHNAATEIRRQFGLEAAQLVLGHSSALITDACYAERDGAKVVEVVRRMG